jgi:flagellar basal body rod protein FlgC
MTPAVANALSGMHAATLKLEASATAAANAGDVSASAGGEAQAVTLKPSASLILDPSSILAGPSSLVSAPEIDPILEVTSQAQAAVEFSAALDVFRAAQREEKKLLDLKT